jgi:hypothetical protein
VSGRPTRERERSDLLESQSQRWKAPGLRKVVALRGEAVERRSRSVQRVVRRSPPSCFRCTDDNGCPVIAEKGNVVSVRKAKAYKTHAPATRIKNDLSRFQGTRPLLGPRTRAFGPLLKGRGNGLVGIAVGKLRAIGRNRHRGQSGRTDSAARRSSSLPQGRGMAGQKRKTVSAVVPARKRELWT